MKHRLFIAIDLPESSRTEIVSVQKKLDKLELPVIWENPAKCHLTLNFLGHVDDPTLHQIKNLVTQAVKNISSFAVCPLYLETLYSRHEPTILYLSIGGDTQSLSDLHNSLSINLDSITPQPRRFLPHITIGKLKRTDPVSTKRFIDRISDFQTPLFSTFKVESVILYKSLLSHSGSTYQKQATFMLQSVTE